MKYKSCELGRGSASFDRFLSGCLLITTNNSKKGPTGGARFAKQFMAPMLNIFIQTIVAMVMITRWTRLYRSPSLMFIVKRRPPVKD